MTTLGKHWKIKDTSKMAISKLGEKNSMWKGNDVGLISLHEWVRNRKPKPEFCERCKKNKPYDLANISQKYKRDINDFTWLCRSCHMKKDGRLRKLIMNGSQSKRRKSQGKLLQCTKCKLFKTKESFTKHKKTFDGLDYHCRKCKSEDYKKYGKKV